MARLDRRRGYYEPIVGSVSDPRLIRRLQELVPDRPITKEEDERVRDLIRYYGHDLLHREDLVRMIFGDNGEVGVAA